MSIENELDAYICGFHLDALSSGVPLNVDLDTTLTVLAGNLYRLFARDLPRYDTATPDTIWRHFLDNTGTLHITDHGVTCALNLRSHHPALIDAGYADLRHPSPGGTTEPYDSASHPADPTRRNANLNSISAPRIEVSGLIFMWMRRLLNSR